MPRTIMSGAVGGAGAWPVGIRPGNPWTSTGGCVLPTAAPPPQPAHCAMSAAAILERRPCDTPFSNDSR